MQITTVEQRACVVYVCACVRAHAYIHVLFSIQCNVHDGEDYNLYLLRPA